MIIESELKSYFLKYLGGKEENEIPGICKKKKKTTTNKTKNKYNGGKIKAIIENKT